MKRLAIIGSGDLAQQIAHHATQYDHYQVVGCFDDYNSIGQFSKGLAILGKIDAIHKCFEQGMFDELIIGIGYNHMNFRQELFLKFEKSIPFATIIHTSCFIDKSTRIGKGTIIYPGCIIDMNTEIGNNCLIYNGCNIAHDTNVANNTILSPGVQIAGFCQINHHVVLGIGTVVSDSIQICEHVRTGAGTVIIKHIIESGLYVGVPAKKIKS
jgi:sugar O-acyltransferase (sialic acid O-acetyltransferase NeuD family)